MPPGPEGSYLAKCNLLTKNKINFVAEMYNELKQITIFLFNLHL